MSFHTAWPSAELVETARLTLEPLCVEHAEEMAPLLDDPQLHEFIGGSPATVHEIQRRYASQVQGHSSDGTEGWLNWIARHRETGAVVDTVQATLQSASGQVSTQLAWVIARPHQHQGYASEAAAGMVGWLRQHGALIFVAHIHPDHPASIAVARRLGLHATDVIVDGEVRWISQPSADINLQDQGA